MVAPLAIFGSLNWLELLVVAAAALMIFGSRLPEVSLRAVAQVMRARRAVSKMWRETGLEDELRRVRRDVELNIPREADFDIAPKKPAPARAAPALPDPGDEGSADQGGPSGTIERGDGPAEPVSAEPAPDADRREPDADG
ncbi:MAG: hypothetical protein AAF726_02140 [Planctomycetota bacterium]